MALVVHCNRVLGRPEPIYTEEDVADRMVECLVKIATLSEEPEKCRGALDPQKTSELVEMATALRGESLKTVMGGVEAFGRRFGGRGLNAEDGRKGVRTATVNGKKVTVPQAVIDRSVAATPTEQRAMEQLSENRSRGGRIGGRVGGRVGGEDGSHKGTEGGSGSGYFGAGQKNAPITLKHVSRVRKGLNPGFTHARCSQGAGKKCGRCDHIEEWNGLAIPDPR